MHEEGLTSGAQLHNEVSLDLIYMDDDMFIARFEDLEFAETDVKGRRYETPVRLPHYYDVDAAAQGRLMIKI